MRFAKCNFTLLQIIFGCFTGIPTLLRLIAQPKKRELILHNLFTWNSKGAK